MWIDLGTKDTMGSEGGTIQCDEEYDSRCRITLESVYGYYAITCGIYGAFVHTAFCGEQDYLEKYKAMKQDLESFLGRDFSEDEESTFYHAFTSKY
ncbi:MAG: hypothetical protein LUF92_08005 [Clostridiales bacterium]|nr:hypothetical protein [Clostridiales bacterium]